MQNGWRGPKDSIFTGSSGIRNPIKMVMIIELSKTQKSITAKIIAFKVIIVITVAVF